MKINCEGYNFLFAHHCINKGLDSHLFTYTYKFYDSMRRKYIVSCEYYLFDVFAIKFYPSSLKTSLHKFNKSTNRNDVFNILKTVSLVVKEVLEKHPTASFCFCGSRGFSTIENMNLVEIHEKTKRYSVFAGVTKELIPDECFTHKAYPKYSSYLLLNTRGAENGEVNILEKKIVTMFCETYKELPDLPDLL